MEYFLGEIRMVAFGYAPVDWALCDGQLIPISQNPNLFSLIGTTYGGDGVTTFALPDFRGRVPIDNSSTHQLGQQGGAENVTLTTDQLPAHTHNAWAFNGTGNQSNPSGMYWASSGQQKYAAGPATQAMMATTILSEGRGQTHDNMMPFLTLNFMICVNGEYPQQA